MEPLFFKAENLKELAYGNDRNLSFNGAAFFQSGKCPRVWVDENGQRVLQWSRFFSKRKITRRQMKPLYRVGRLQWSRFFSKRKMVSSTLATIFSTPWLQWSRFFSKRKMLLKSGLQLVNEGCFNGAAFFQSGKYALGFGWTPKASRCFNGAAFFQSGKFKGCLRRVNPQDGVLQWSRFFSKRKILRLGRLFGLFQTCASMEPLFFKAENTGRGFIIHRLRELLQWSRFFSKRKMRRQRQCGAGGTERASMEPLFFKAENA